MGLDAGFPNHLMIRDEFRHLEEEGEKLQLGKHAHLME